MLLLSQLPKGIKSGSGMESESPIDTQAVQTVGQCRSFCRAGGAVVQSLSLTFVFFCRAKLLGGEPLIGSPPQLIRQGPPKCVDCGQPTPP